MVIYGHHKMVIIYEFILLRFHVVTLRQLHYGYDVHDGHYDHYDGHRDEHYDLNRDDLLPFKIN